MEQIKILPKRALHNWIARLMRQNYRIIAPVERHGQFVFEQVTSSEQIVMDYPISALPPKKFLLPPREELFNFNTRTLEMQATIEAEPTVILGLHSCDMNAIALLDKVNSTGFADQHYQARRQATVLVSIECFEPCSPHSFCRSMNTLSVPDNYDLHFIDIGDDYAIYVGSEKGEALFTGCVSVWEATETDYQRVDDVISEKWGNFDYPLDMDITELPDVLGASKGSPLWDELGDRCLACGMCTQVCPTCYCFDVEDEVDLSLENGTRVRTWDSCQIDKFAVVAGGHDFRSQRGARQRHRFMRKGKWQYEAYGMSGCVGCGRCAIACLVDITPVNTFNALYAEQQAAAEERVDVAVEEVQ